MLANLKFPQITPKVAVRQHMELVEFCFGDLRSVTDSFGVKMWQFELGYGAVAPAQPVILFCSSC